MKKKSHLIRIVVATFALLLTFGCVTQTDMDTLQIERQQDRGRIKQLEAELEESKQLLKEEIEKSQTPVRQRTADMWAEIQSLRADFAKLRGELETMEIRMDRQVGATNSTMTMSSLGDQLDEIEFILENQTPSRSAKSPGRTGSSPCSVLCRRSYGNSIRRCQRNHRSNRCTAKTA